MTSSEPKLMVDSLRAKAIAQADAGDGQGLFKEPKRKRGFHRALKRGATWAKMKQGMKDMMNSIARQMFEDILKPSPLMSLLPQTDSDRKSGD